MTDLFYAMKLDAPNSQGGQPRRGWLVYDSAGQLAGFANDGGESYQALKRAAARLAGNENRHGAEYVENGYESTGTFGTVRVIELGIVNVPFGEYRIARKQHTQF